jgi:hypothetical protein
VGAGGVADDREAKRLGDRALSVLIEEERNCFEAGAMDGADLGYGRPEFASQFENVNLAATRLHEVGHIEENQGGKADGENGRSEHQLTGEVQGIEDQEDGVGLGRTGHFAAEDVDGDTGVLGVRAEGVDPGKIDEGEVVASYAGHEAHVLLDGDTRVVCHLLAEAGEAVEEG